MTPINLLPHDGEVYLFKNLFTAAECARYEENLLQEVQWKQEPIQMFGKWIMQPRRTTWYGDPGISYAYSGITMHSLPWTETLLAIKTRIEPPAAQQFNSVLLNHYRDQRDSMGWHSDDEKELGKNPVIGSVSFGATRKFQFRHRQDKSLKVSVDLTNGSFLLMAGATQHHWSHCLPKATKPMDSRINLTFRRILA